MKFKGQNVTFLGWLENVWYHYKAQIIIGFFSVVFVSIALTQCLSREKHDVFIYSAGNHTLSVQKTEEFKQDMEIRYAEDANKDGDRVVGVKIDQFTMAISPDSTAGVFNPEKQVSELASFQIELSNGECVIYLLHESFFYPNLKYFESFESALGYVPENAIRQKGLRIGDLDAYRTSTLSYFPEDYIICLADKENRLDSRYYEGNVEFFKNLINNTIAPK